MKSIRKPRPSYIIIAASAAQLSLTGCHSNVKTSCQEKYDPSTCPTVNPAPISKPEDLDKSEEAFIHQFDFDTLSMELMGGIRPIASGEAYNFTIQKDALNPRQTEILKSLYEITDLTKLSCEPDVDGIAYKMVLYKNQTAIHNIMSSNGYCFEAKTLRDVTFVEATALKNFYLSKP